MIWLLVGALGCSFDVEKEGAGVGECGDGIDNDANGTFDCADPACAPECGADSDVDSDADTDTGSATDSGTGTGSDTGTGADCDAQFSSAPSYQACTERDGHCVFDTRTNRRQSCGEICAELGGTCVAALGESDRCVEGGEVEACDFADWERTICECALTCGAGPACAVGVECIDGVCG